jgi:hypothetical protein
LLCDDDDDDDNGGGDKDNNSNFTSAYQWYDVKTKIYKNVLNFFLVTSCSRRCSQIRRQ